MISEVVSKFNNSEIFPALAFAALRPQDPLVLWNFPLRRAGQSQFQVWFSQSGQRNEPRGDFLGAA